MNKRALIITILVAVVLLGVVAFALTRNTAAPASNNNQTANNNPNDATPQDNNSNSSDSSSAENVQYMLVYGNSGFVKSAIEVPAGATVTVRNDSDSTLDFASDDHPTHTQQPALNIGDIAPGDSKTFTIKSPGTWGFHNHLDSSHAGQIIVK